MFICIDLQVFIAMISGKQIHENDIDNIQAQVNSQTETEVVREKTKDDVSNERRSSFINQ